MIFLQIPVAFSLFRRPVSPQQDSPYSQSPALDETCRPVDLSQYNYKETVRSGYLNVGKGNSALAFIFYGKIGAKLEQVKNFPTIIWLNGGPGSSSQLGNFMELGPLFIERKNSAFNFYRNNYTWANDYNILFVDQPVGTGLSYADENYTDVFVHDMNQVSKDFYNALKTLYEKSCFKTLGIKDSDPLFIFGESYAGKYVPSIAAHIVSQWSENNTFLKTGFKGVAIGDGFTHPSIILRQTPSFAYNLGLLQFNQRSRVELKALNNTFQIGNKLWREAHDSFDDIIDEVVRMAGNVNVYNIRLFRNYDTQIVGQFFNKDGTAQYGLNRSVIFGKQSDKVYDGLYEDFMQNYVLRVQYLLMKGIPVLVYNGQNDLIVPNPGTMRWVDSLQFKDEHEFRAKSFVPVKLGNHTVGVKKEAGKLELRIIFNAGHLVPMDQPLVSLEMVREFVKKNMK